MSKTLNRCDYEKGQPLICSNVSAIQVDDTYTYYINNKNLYRARLDNMQKELLIENVVKFLVYDKYIIVMRNANNDDYLYTLSYSDRKRRPVFYDLFHGVYWFGIYKDTLIFTSGVTLANRIYQHEFGGDGYTDLGEFANESNDIQISQNNLVLNNNGIVKLYNLESKNTKQIFTNSHLSNTEIICNDKYVFVSYKEIAHYPTNDLPTQRNGLYRIDLETYEQIRIDKNVYEELYLFGDYVFGLKSGGKEIYQISLDGKTINKVK